MAAEEILRFEGLKLGGSTMGCVRTKRVFSSALGRYITRCAEYDKGGLSLGAFKIPGLDIGQIKDTLITGGVAVGGAVVTQRAVAYLAPLVNIDSTSRWMPAIEIGTGIALGIVVSKISNKPDLGAAFAMGPVVVNGLRLVSGLLSPNSGVAGIARQQALAYQQQLGVVQDMAAFPPETMYERDYSESAQQQYPMWAA